MEDIYEPFKGVKSTRADFAIKNNLESLANIISCMKYSKEQIGQKARAFLNTNIKDVDTCINSAMDIIALRYSQEIKTKESLRKNLENHALLTTKKTKTFEEEGIYKELKDIKQKASYIKSHRLLAVFRAVNEKQLSLKVEVDEAYITTSDIKKPPKHPFNYNGVIGLLGFIFSKVIFVFGILILPPEFPANNFS